MSKSRLVLTSLLVAPLLAACGGGGGGGGGPSGVLLDSAVGGVDYSTSGGGLGTTDANGTFRYGNGQSVLFRIGDVILGNVQGAAVVTPVDLILGAADESDPGVINLARFLQTLDLDQDPSNGITVDESVRLAAVGVTIDFDQSVAAFETGEQTKVDTLTAGLPGGSRALVDAQMAQDHLGDTLRRVVAGRYDGRFAGDDAGPFHVFVDRNGSLFGWAVSATDGLLELEGGADTDGGFLAGNVSSGATFQGTIEGDGTLAGTWELSPESGTFSGTRSISVADALDDELIAMLAGTYEGTIVSTLGSSAFTLTLDAQGNLAVPPPDDQVSGTIVSTNGTSASFRGLTSDGTEIRGTVQLSGAMSGNLENDLLGATATFTATRM